MSETLPDTDRPMISGEPANASFLAYDFFKSFTSLCMITLGGILTLSETIFGRQFEPWQMMAVSLPVAFSGIIALQCQTDLVQIANGVSPRSPFFLKYGLRLAPAFYGGGIGAFLVVLCAAYFL